jgi:hypothetical protein
VGAFTSPRCMQFGDRSAGRLNLLDSRAFAGRSGHPSRCVPETIRAVHDRAAVRGVKQSGHACKMFRTLYPQMNGLQTTWRETRRPSLENALRPIRVVPAPDFGSTEAAAYPQPVQPRERKAKATQKQLGRSHKGSVAAGRTRIRSPGLTLGVQSVKSRRLNRRLIPLRATGRHSATGFAAPGREAAARVRHCARPSPAVEHRCRKRES